MPPRLYSYSLARLALGVAFGVLLLAPAEDARADCVQLGTVVTCSDDDTDGFDAGAQDDLVVDVEAGATVENAAGDVMVLNNGNAVTITGSVEATDAAATALSAGDDNTIDVGSAGSISSAGSGGSIVVGNDNTLNIDGSVDSTGAAATAISAGDGTTLDIGVAGSVTSVGNGIVVGTGGSLTLDGLSIGNGAAVISTGDNAIAIDAGEGTSVQLNGGSRVRASGADSIAIRLATQDGIDELDANNGSVVFATGDGGIGVSVGEGGTSGANIDNRGRIVGGSGTGSAVSFEASGVADTNVFLNGTSGLLFTSDGDTIFVPRPDIVPGSGVAIRGGPGSEVITNRGEILGDILLMGGDDVFEQSVSALLDGPQGQELEGRVDGGAGSDALRLIPRVTSAPTDQSIFNLDNALNFETLEIQAATWLLRGTGNFADGVSTGADARVLIFDPVVINGDWVQAGSSELGIALTADPDSGHLEVNGSFDIIDATSAELTTLRVAPSGFLTTGSYEIISASGGIIGEFEDVIFAGGSDLLSFDLFTGANSIDVLVTRASYQSLASSPNGRAVARALDAISAAAPSATAVALLNDIDTLPSNSAVERAFQSLHPEAYDAHSSRMISLGRGVADAALRERPNCRSDYEFRVGHKLRQQPKPCADSGRSAWASAFGDFVDRSGPGSHLDYESTGWGAAAGLDQAIGDWLLTGFVGSAGDRMDIRRVGQGRLHSVEVGAAVQRNFGALRASALLGYGRGWHTQERSIATTTARRVEGEFGSNRIGLRGEVGYGFAINSQLRLEPNARVDFSYLSEEAFSESGDRGARLRVNKRDSSLVSTAIGGRLTYEGLWYYWLGEYFEWMDGVWQTELSGHWLRNWSDADRKLEARLIAGGGAGDFSVQARDVEQGGLLGAHLRFQPKYQQFTLGLGYDLQIGDGTTAHRVGGEFRLPF